MEGGDSEMLRQLDQPPVTPIGEIEEELNLAWTSFTHQNSVDFLDVPERGETKAEDVGVYWPPSSVAVNDHSILLCSTKIR